MTFERPHMPALAYWIDRCKRALRNGHSCDPQRDHGLVQAMQAALAGRQPTDTPTE